MSEKKEYIERGALLLALGEKRAVLNGLSEYGYLQVIREVPAADVEPVVRGELRFNEQGFLECSACSRTLFMASVIKALDTGIAAINQIESKEGEK